MEIRELRHSDASEIQAVARESLSASYGHALDDEQIASVVEQWYAEDAIESLLSEEELIFMVAANDEISGYVQGEIIAGDTVIGDIHWLHVRPDKRGDGLGSQLLGEVIDRMKNEGISLARGRVLGINQDGVTFYQEHGFTKASSSTIDLDGEEYEEVFLERQLSDEEVLESIEGPDGEQLYIDYTGGETGVLAPLYPTFRDETLEERHGWFCSNCDSTETSMGSSGRIECSNCENARKATRWDSSYL
jgi:ribosomal protein S18 acetylase RimI-like enzyme